MCSNFHSRTVLVKEMLQVSKNGNKKYGVKKQDASRINLVEDLNRAIWPSNDINKFLTLLQEAGPEYMDVRHGSRHETFLHRFGFYLHNYTILFLFSTDILWFQHNYPI